MEQTTLNTRRETKPAKSKRTERLSPDRKWRSFPKVPNLLQYVSTGLYFARVKVNGKLFRQSLGTKEHETATLKLHDYLSGQKKKRRVQGAPTVFKEARILFESASENDHTISAAHLRYRKACIAKLLGSWIGLEEARLTSIKPHDCGEWAKKLSTEISPQFFNNILGTFKAILKRAGIEGADSPLSEVKRVGIPLVSPTLPEPEQFQKIIEAMETSGAGQQQHCADFARFLAFSGCRLSEARGVTWADVDLDKGFVTIHNAKTRRARNYSPTRRVPIIPDMRQLLERLRKYRPEPSNSVCKVGECEKSLARACKQIEIPKLTHHDLRHLFATRCIEAGVDIPTVSRWLGHSDGGALAMKVYGHLREKHSADMAQKVTFSQPMPANVLPLRKEATK